MEQSKKGFPPSHSLLSQKGRKIIICKNCNEHKPHKAFGLCFACYLKDYKIKNNLKYNHKSTIIITCKICNKSSLHGGLNLCNSCYSKKDRLKRKLIKNQVNHSFTYESWIKIKNQTKGVCPSCNKNVGLTKITMDHIIPLSKAPKDFIYNINDIQPLCFSCNSKKGVKITTLSKAEAVE